MGLLSNKEIIKTMFSFFLDIFSDLRQTYGQPPDLKAEVAGPAVAIMTGLSMEPLRGMKESIHLFRFWGETTFYLLIYKYLFASFLAH